MDSLELMRLGTDARFPVTLRKFEVWLRPLTVAETVKLSSEVADELNNKPHIARNAINEHVLFSIKTLSLASTSAPDKGDPKLTSYVLENLTPDELAYLFKCYCQICDRVNPALEELSVERLNQLVREAKKNPAILIELSFSDVASVCRALLASLPEDR
jgi:hypothetical protein